jgi:osmoprotectant transport system permease protein
MGYTDRQLLWKVEVPLAIPAIAAGIRIATVTTIGLVTVTSLIGLGGLGYYIRLGLQRTFSTAVILGGALSFLLAVLIDIMLLGTERWLTPWMRRRRREALA